MTASLPFADRDAAARQLARALARFGDRHPVVLAIPRGAVPMGRIIADALGGELDVVLVRKLGAPGHAELAIGAVDERGHVSLSRVAQLLGAGEAYVREEARRQLALIHERRQAYCSGRPALSLAGRTVIVVDDGLATGATMSAALRMARLQEPAHLVCAVPVASPDSLAQVAGLADEVVCLATPRDFQAVGQFYVAFPSIEDEEVIATLAPSTSPAR